MKIHYLFFLVLTSTAAFSMYLYLSAIVVNPLVYVLLGWGPAVAAYYLTEIWELTRLFVLNRTFDSFIIDKDSLVWDGKMFIEDGEPLIFYNSVQVDREIKKIINLTGDCDLFIKIFPQQNDECDCDIDFEPEE